MTETDPKAIRPWLQFGLRHVFLWSFALASAFTIGRLKEKYEPYLGDIGHISLLLVLTALGVTSGGITGRAVFSRAGAIIGSVLGLLILFGAFILSVSLN